MSRFLDVSTRNSEDAGVTELNSVPTPYFEGAVLL